MQSLIPGTCIMYINEWMSLCCSTFIHTLSKGESPFILALKYPAASNKSMVCPSLTFCSSSSRTSNCEEKSIHINTVTRWEKNWWTRLGLKPGRPESPVRCSTYWAIWRWFSNRSDRHNTIDNYGYYMIICCVLDVFLYSFHHFIKFVIG